MTTVFNATTTPTTARPGDPTLRSAESIPNAPTAARLRRDYGIRSLPIRDIHMTRYVPQISTFD